MSAAYALKKKGIEAIVLETDSVAGGRARGDKVGGFSIEVGAEFMTGAFEQVGQLAEELNVEIIPFLDDTGIIDRNSKVYGRKSRREVFLANSLKTLYQFVKLLRYCRKNRDSLTFGDPTKLEQIDDPDTSLHDVVVREGGEAVLKNIIEPTVCGICLISANRIGVAMGLNVLWSFFFGSHGFKLGSFMRAFTGGFGAFMDALYEAIKDNVRLNTAAEKIVIADGKVTGVQTNQGFIEADVVICATTASIARKITPDLPQDWQERLSAVGYAPGVDVIWGSKGKLLRDKLYGYASAPGNDSPLVSYGDQCVKSPGSGPPESVCLHIKLAPLRTGGEKLMEMSDEEIEQVAIEQIERFDLPKVENPSFCHVIRHKEAMCHGPSGMFRAVAPLRLSDHPEARGLFFAGDYLHIPSSNGAVTSGMRAAEMVEEALARA